MHDCTLARRVLAVPIATSLREAVASGAPAVVRAALDAKAIDAVLQGARDASAPWLVPRPGENIVSGERNPWTAPRDGGALLDGERGQARVDAPAAALRSLERRARARADADESAIFVTSAAERKRRPLVPSAAETLPVIPGPCFRKATPRCPLFLARASGMRHQQSIIENGLRLSAQVRSPPDAAPLRPSFRGPGARARREAGSPHTAGPVRL